jgi:dTDP-4-amino-4,6-dideoxygalactose transaminase
VAKRERRCQRCRAVLDESPPPLVVQLQSTKSARRFFTIGMPSGVRDRAIAALNAAWGYVTVSFRTVTRTIHHDKRYYQAAAACPVSKACDEQPLTLPTLPGLTEAEQEHVIHVVCYDDYPLDSNK